MAYVDILILQNLVARPAHGYEVKKSVERIMGGAFAVNNNVLYPALRRFEEMGAVESEVVHQEGKPDRHVYRATELGEEILGELLREFPPEVARNDAEFQVRVAFFGLLEPKERLKILDTRREFLEGLLDHLRVVGSQAEDNENVYAAKVVEFQRSAVEHELAWISGLAEEVRHD
jgi:DNA-binding PadR family transcriptional regulator